MSTGEHFDCGHCSEMKSLSDNQARDRKLTDRRSCGRWKTCRQDGLEQGHTKRVLAFYSNKVENADFFSPMCAGVAKDECQVLGVGRNGQGQVCICYANVFLPILIPFLENYNTLLYHQILCFYMLTFT